MAFKNFFTVHLRRTAHRFMTLQVQANSQEEADKLGLEKAGDHEFPSEKDAEYSLANDLKDDNRGLYLLLFHGRSHPQEKLEDWGSDGPIIGPVGMSSTYGNPKLHDVAGTATVELPMYEGFVVFDGKYYGDYEVLTKSEVDFSKELEKRGRELIGFETFSSMVEAHKQTMK